MSQFQIPGQRPFPFKAISIRFAYTNFSDTIGRTQHEHEGHRKQLS